jgi:hypothetical protein
MHGLAAQMLALVDEVVVVKGFDAINRVGGLCHVDFSTRFDEEQLGKA